MKSLLSWRQIGGDSSRQPKPETSTGSSRARTISALQSSGSANQANPSFTEPQDVLYPTKPQPQFPTTTRDTYQAKSGRSTAKSMKNGMAFAPHEGIGSSPDSVGIRFPNSTERSRIRFDSLVIRGHSSPPPAPSARAPSHTSRWGNAWERAKGRTSMRPKKEVGLPADLARPPHSLMQKELPAEDIPFYVLGQRSRSATGSTPRSPPNLSQEENLTSSTEGRRKLTQSPIQRSQEAPTETKAYKESISLQALNGDDHLASVHTKTAPQSISSGLRDPWSLDDPYDKNSMDARREQNPPSSLLSRSGSHIEKHSTGVHSIQEPSQGDKESESHSSSNAADSLADQLNSLGVAFGEGLLSEDEYRLLRQGVFEKMSSHGAMDVPKEATVRQTSKHAQRPTSSQADDNGSLAAPTVQSRRSTKSQLVSLFSPSISRGSTHQNGKSRSSILPSTMSTNSGAPSSSVGEHLVQARRARTLRSRTSLRPSDNDSLASSANQTYSRPASISPNSRIPGSVSYSGGNALFGRDYADKNSTEISAEIAILKAEESKIIESFHDLETHAIGKYNLNVMQVRQATKGLDIDLSGGIEDVDGFVVIDTEDNWQANGASSSTSKKFGDRLRRRQSSSEVRKGTKDKKQPSHAPTSFRAHNFPEHRNTLTSGSSSDVAIDAGVVSLRRELLDIQQRIKEVSKRYGDRIAFLESASRSAKIREGLR